MKRKMKIVYDSVKSHKTEFHSYHLTLLIAFARKVIKPSNTFEHFMMCLKAFSLCMSYNFMIYGFFIYILGKIDVIQLMAIKIN